MDHTGKQMIRGSVLRRAGPVLTLAAVVAAGLVGIGVPAHAVTVTVSTATTVDNYYDLYVDGDCQISTSMYGQGDWPTAESWTGSLALGQEHVVAVKGSNYTPWTSYNPASFLGQIDPGPGLWFAGEDADHTDQIVTDDQWLVYYNAGGTPPVDCGTHEWTEVEYDVSDFTGADAWVDATEIGLNGVTPPW